MKSLCSIFLVIVFFSSLLFAAEPPAPTADPGKVVVASEPAPRSTGAFDINSYTWSIRIGGGYSCAFQNFRFDREAKVFGAKIEIDDIEEDMDWGFTYPNFAGNIECKWSMPFYERLAFGVALDYNIVPLKDVEATATIFGSTFSLDGDVADVHTFALLAFLEYRHPIQVGQSWLSPYIRLGLGVNLNGNDNSDLLKVDTGSFAMMASIGVEYHVSQNVSLFVEPRWHYNRPKFEMELSDDIKVGGTLNLSNLTFLVGINFYFGHRDRNEVDL